MRPQIISDEWTPVFRHALQNLIRFIGEASHGRGHSFNDVVHAFFNTGRNNAMGFIIGELPLPPPLGFT